MNDEQKTNRRYRISYILMPLPMLAAMIIAAYIYINKDVDTDCYCVLAKASVLYDQLPASAQQFQKHTKMKLTKCENLDQRIDQADGRTSGKVRWFVCTGMSCGPQWEQILSTSPH